MIDYDKLKAYLEHKRLEIHKTCLTDKFDNGYFWAIKDTEAFVQELEKELTQPEPKYEISQILWINSYESGVFSIEVHDVIPYEESFIYRDEVGSDWPESQCYPTKTALIDAQIEYWCSLIERAPSEMLHDYHSPQTEEYCEHSGIKLGKHPIFGQMESLPSEDLAALKKVPYDECEHESDGILNRLCDLAGISPEIELGYKCIKCGGFYR